MFETTTIHIYIRVFDTDFKRDALTYPFYIDQVIAVARSKLSGHKDFDKLVVCEVRASSAFSVDVTFIAINNL